jgi:hypothetical protein
VPELGGALDEQDLVELGEHQCYARISARGQRVPTFSVHLDPPMPADAELRTALMRASAERYGRPAELVEADRRSALARVLAARTRQLPPQPARPPARNEHRPRKKNRKAQVVNAAGT